LFNISHQTFWPMLKENLCITIWKFLSFGNTFLIFFLPFSQFTIQMSNVVYKFFLTFSKKHDGQYSEVICLFKFENFYLLVKLFSFFYPFTVYNLNNSYFIYEIFSKLQLNYCGRYSKGIGVFKFEYFHLLVKRF